MHLCSAQLCGIEHGTKKNEKYKIDLIKNIMNIKLNTQHICIEIEI